MNQEVVILGAGLAGLGCALDLPGCRVFEARGYPGGHAYSHPGAGIHFDQGAHICHSKDQELVAQMVAAAGAVQDHAACRVGNVWRGQWLTYPVQNHLHELQVEHRMAALTDLVMAHANAAPPAENYSGWCKAQYGEFLARHFYEVFTAKYWRVPMEELATDWLGGRLLPSVLPRIVRGAFQPQKEDQAVFTRFRYPARGGFFGFFAPLYQKIQVAYHHQAVALEVRNRRVRFANGRRESYSCLGCSLPLPTLVQMIEDAPAEIRAAAARLRWTQLLCVNLVVRGPQPTDAHWFYIYDPEPTPARVSVPSNLAPGSLPPDQTALQCEIFRRQDEPMPVDELADQARRGMEALFGFSTSDVVFMQSVHVPFAYVISDHERAKAVALILPWLESHDIYPMGLYGRWQYVWSDAAFRQGQAAAAAIRARLQSRRRAG